MNGGFLTSAKSREGPAVGVWNASEEWFEEVDLGLFFARIRNEHNHLLECSTPLRWAPSS